MRYRLAGVLTTAVVITLAVQGPAADEKTVKLFDGQSFAGWTGYMRPAKDGTVPDWKKTWSVEGGVIRCSGKPNGYIATEKEYGDYVLRLKWRYPADSKGGNSGVLLHTQKEDKVWPTSVEAQLASGRAGDFWLIMPPEVKLDVDKARQDPKQARHYFRIGKDDPVEKPFGEWNQYEITCRGGDVTLVVNGKTVNEGKNGNLTRGRIALQSEGAEIHFKDIELQPLK